MYHSLSTVIVVAGHYNPISKPKFTFSLVSVFVMLVKQFCLRYIKNLQKRVRLTKLKLFKHIACGDIFTIGDRVLSVFCVVDVGILATMTVTCNVGKKYFRVLEVGRK